MTAAVGSPGRVVSSRALSHRRHYQLPCTLAVLVMAGALGAGIHQGVWEHSRRETLPVTTAAAAVTEGEVRLTKAEMSTLRIVPVLEREFRSERLIEGRIAYDDEGVTPVFSPYDGARVLRAVAQAGDTVHRGDTLFEVESADLLRSEGELLSRADQAEKARTALGLARSELARQRALLRARAASQRGLEQAEVDATSATAELRTAEAALATARARLGVLGRSPQQIAELEVNRHPDAV